MTQLFSLFSITLSMMFLVQSPPLLLSLVIILQTIILASIISMYTMTSWFSFMLLMIYLSGMMIVFIYVSSMASNELFQLNTSHSYYFSFFLVTFMALSGPHISPPSNNMNLLDLSLLQIPITKTMKMYSKSLFTMTILLIIYLLLTMIMVVKTTSFSEGPMRASK
uniref:NADH dehydrogenase subunit 6 n=1 Tax=Pseudoniphargus stocki TaxID=2211535 RepID=A0A345K5T6_9CRUS|nr:NADH dehydrogenase subunit 6 [Pseudoniphargus stocki]AXH38228.1 NADH dehydrogenase subunit 6 [Pseudoniphargus stocki]